MLFNSYQFLLFFPIVVLIYYIIPSKVRYIWLLITSYYYYMCWDAKYALLILASTAITYFSGIWISKINEKNYESERARCYKKRVVLLSFLSNIGILVFFKYSGWLLDNINLFLENDIALPFSIVLPVGISFYTFQALSYTMDVYRGEIYAEKNFLRYALFVSFFPQLVAGPIERSKNLLKQLDCTSSFSYDNTKSGLLLMLWGFFEKIVIADKAAIFVDSVYNNYTEQHGSVIFLATVMFAIQIYCDFGGYSHIAIGAARVLNIRLMDNFRQPYFAVNIKDFWNRWHISLSTWFRDYLYIPLGGNRQGRLKKNRNLFITFLVSGLWHGASWHFVIWGMLHGLYQIISDVMSPLKNKLQKIIHVKRNCFSYHLYQRCLTFILVTIAWLFFRVGNMKEAFIMLSKMILEFNPSALATPAILESGLNLIQFATLFIAVLILFMVDFLHEKGIHIAAWLNEQNMAFRWAAYYAVVLFIVISFIQTFGVDASTFIYFQF